MLTFWIRLLSFYELLTFSTTVQYFHSNSNYTVHRMCFHSNSNYTVHRMCLSFHIFLFRTFLSDSIIIPWLYNVHTTSAQEFEISIIVRCDRVSTAYSLRDDCNSLLRSIIGNSNNIYVDPSMCYNIVQCSRICKSFRPVVPAVCWKFATCPLSLLYASNLLKSSAKLSNCYLGAH